MEKKSRKDGRIIRKKAMRLFQEDNGSELTNKEGATAARQKVETLNPKRSMSIYHSNIGSPLAGAGQNGAKKDIKSSQKNINVR